MKTERNQVGFRSVFDFLQKKSSYFSFKNRFNKKARK